MCGDNVGVALVSYEFRVSYLDEKIKILLVAVFRIILISSLYQQIKNAGRNLAALSCI